VFGNHCVAALLLQYIAAKVSCNIGIAAM